MSADNHLKKMAACYYAEYFQAALWYIYIVKRLGAWYN